MVAAKPHDPQPFDALDHEWALICHRHRRSRIVAVWAQQEPALTGIGRLADVIPPLGTDRAPVTAAVARLQAAGDDLAGRTLLQLLVPGLIRLTAFWRIRCAGGVNEAGWEIITRAGIYIAHLRDGTVGCAPAGYILRSVHRDLVLDARAQHHHDTTHLDLASLTDTDHRPDLEVPSAEDTVSEGLDIRLALDDAAAAGVIPPDAVELVWLILTGVPLDDATPHTGHARTTAYRYRNQALDYLRQQPVVTDTEAHR